MQVELLYESEVADQPHDISIEAMELLKNLGLEGQLKLYSRNQENRVTTDVFPFVPATREQLFVYAYHFPKCVAIEKYSAEAIPLRVLEVLKLAKQSDRFHNFILMCPEDNTVKDDSVLVGVIKTGEYNYESYLLARWGRALEAYFKLKEEAFAGYRKRVKEECSKMTAHLANLMSSSDAKLLKEMDIAYNEHCKYIRGSILLPYTSISTD